MDIVAFNLDQARKSVATARTFRCHFMHAEAIECLNRAAYFRRWAMIEMRRVG